MDGANEIEKRFPVIKSRFLDIVITKKLLIDHKRSLLSKKVDSNIMELVWSKTHMHEREANCCSLMSSI